MVQTPKSVLKGNGVSDGKALKSNQSLLLLSLLLNMIFFSSNYFLMLVKFKL